MNNSTDTSLVTALTLKLLLLSSVLLVLPHIANLKPTFLIISFSLLAWRLLIFRHPKYLPHRWVLLPVSIALALFVVKSYGMSLGRDASSSLLIVLLGLKLLECHKKRDVLASVFVGFFVMITPFLFEQTIPLALYCFINLLLLFSILMINSAGINSLKCVTLIKFTGKITLQALPLMLIAFVLFPRIVGPLWALPDDASSATSGISETLNPGQISSLALSNETAFQVTFKGSSPKQQDLYWRGPVFLDTDGKKWTHKPLHSKAKQAINTSQSNTHEYSIILQPHQQQWVYSLDNPLTKIKSAVLTADFQLLLKKKLSRSLSYELISAPILQTTISDKLRSRALALPKNTSQDIYDLANQLSISNNTQKTIKQGLAYFNQQDFYYTLRPPRLGENPVSEFLFTSKRGFCSHYATSFTVLMRAAGIPARLVAGYHGGVYNSVGDFWRVRQADAHVWVEVWVENIGWKRVDPTAAISPNRILHSVDLAAQLSSGDATYLMEPPDGWRKWAQQSEWMLQTLDYYWQSAVLAYGPETQLEFLGSMGISGWEDMIKWLSIFSGGFLLVFILYLKYINTTNKNTVDYPQKLFLTFCTRLGKQYGNRYPHETASDYFARIEHQNPLISKPLMQIKEHYLLTRYGKKQGDTLQQLIRKFKF